MSLSNIYVSDTKAQFKDISCKTLNCDVLNVAGGSGDPLVWTPTISGPVNLTGAWSVDYARYSKVGNVVTADLNISGFTINAQDANSSFIFTLPANVYVVSTETKLIGAGRVFQYPVSNTTVVNSGATPDRCTVNFQSATGSAGVAVDILVNVQYIAMDV